MNENHKSTLLQAFLGDFSRAVTSGDIGAMRPHFDSEVLSYGTRAIMCEGIEDLVSKQWIQIWGKCKSWKIISVDAMNLSSDLAFVAFRWSRVSLDGSGQSGRATLTFRFVGTRLVVLHSHFSEASDLR